MTKFIKKFYKNNINNFSQYLGNKQKEYNVKIAEKFQKLNMTRIENKNFIENEIFQFNLKFQENQNSKILQNFYKIDDKKRESKNLWHKIWKKYRIFGPWKYRKFIFQKNSDFDYNNYKLNDFIFYKIVKYETKIKSRPFVKICFKELDFVQKYNDELNSFKLNKKEVITNPPTKKKEDTSFNLLNLANRKMKTKGLTKTILGFLNKKYSFS